MKRAVFACLAVTVWLASCNALLDNQLDASLMVPLRKVPGRTEKLRGIDTLIELRRDPVWAITPFRLDVK